MKRLLSKFCLLALLAITNQIHATIGLDAHMENLSPLEEMQQSPILVDDIGTAVLFVYCNNYYRGYVTINGQETSSYIGNLGDVVTIQATSFMDYYFQNWSDGDTNPIRNITLTENTDTLIAFFVTHESVLTININDTSRGQVTINGIQTTVWNGRVGDTVTLVAQAYGNNDFQGWGDGFASATRTYVLTNWTATLNASFSPPVATLTISVNDTSGGHVCVNGRVSVLYQGHLGDEVGLSAIAHECNVFNSWSDSCVESTRSYTLLRVSDTLMVTFNVAQYGIVVNINDTNLGTTTFPFGNIADCGDTLIVVASPVDHYHVASWSGVGIVNTSALKDTVWLIMSADRILECNFAIDTHVVNVVANDIACGLVSGGGQFPYGSPCSVSATAYTGYTFHCWSNGVTANPYTFAVMEDVDLIAEFVVEGPEGMDDIINNGINVWPSGGCIYIEGNKGEAIQVLDIVGRRIANTVDNCISVPTSGMYFVRIGTLPARKVVVIR